jgi:hydroxyacylglutathione hydrolase
MRNSLSPVLLLLLLNLVRDLTHASGIPQYRKFFKSGLSSTACADVYVVPMFDVNYGFIFIDRVTNKAAIIDPGEPGPVIYAAKELYAQVEMALVTHRHGDHSGGNTAVKEAFPGAEIMGPTYEKIRHMSKGVSEGDSIILGSLKIDVLHTPCHTKGHVVYLVSPNDHRVDVNAADPLLFSGDTLFVGGCGNFNEGTATDMLKNMDRLGNLPAETQVYCGHEFTFENLQFLSTIDTHSGSETSEMLADVTKKRETGEATIPSTIGRELEYNLFMKCREPLTQKLLDRQSPTETMTRLRELRNQFRSQ